MYRELVERDQREFAARSAPRSQCPIADRHMRRRGPLTLVTTASLALAIGVAFSGCGGSDNGGTSHGIRPAALRSPGAPGVAASSTSSQTPASSSSTLSLQRSAISSTTAPVPSPTASSPTTAAPLVFSGSGDSVTLLNGSKVTLSALKGSGPALVWFVADGCASCASSVPVIASHLSDFSSHGVQVLAIGMYGFFAPGSQGLGELANFAQQAESGISLSNPAWNWGMSSESLTSAYDPQGVPDAYFLLDSSGHVAYQDSVPVSSIDALMAHVKELEHS